ncbi:MAG: ABC transporter ATP-binding protein [Thermoanaerobaculales bacterium]|nr:ABC transporter ATP-binding protein [Thermoanaerobaculales bacterium]
MVVAVRAEGLGKKYVIRHGPSEQFPTLRDEIAAKVGGVFRRLVKPVGGTLGSAAMEKETFWALSGVEFEIDEGERVGIIGRNGAGKTTLLKVLSRITQPTTGRVSINGRIASLLEVGTGFHPELTGRENIFLNGAILGMGRAEIRRVFDDIVAFAEVERFLDTPVKRYSSGMYVRLAFSVAAHLDPEILVVDEVLAVGDLDFQQKCLGKMREVGRSGRTVLFVSHNMHAVEALCDRAIVLDRGLVVFDGGVGEAVSHYRTLGSSTEGSIEACAKRVNKGGFRISELWLENAARERPRAFSPGEEIHLRMTFEVEEDFDGKEVEVGFGIDNELGDRIFTAVSTWGDTPVISREGTTTVACVISALPLVGGRYLVSASVGYRGLGFDYVQQCSVLNIKQIGKSWANRGIEHGHIDVPYRFSLMDE